MILLEDDLFLAAVQSCGMVYLIFTLSKKNKSPYCSKCSTQKCKHYRQYVAHKNEENNDNESNRSNESISSSSDDGNTATVPPVDHYDTTEPIDEYTRKFGFNLTRITYPFSLDPESQEIWIKHLNGEYDLPDRIFPEFIAGFSCQHDNTYDPNDDNLVEISPNIIIYTETSERVFPIKTYGRKTLGRCKCKQQADTHKLLLWHLGRGKMIDYLFLSFYMHNMRTNGISKEGLIRSRQERLNSIGVKTTLTKSDFLRASNGFISKIHFHDDLKTFSCPNCGNSPKYLVADGKSDGPSKRRVDHLKELGTADDDTGFLPQASKFKDRTFLSNQAERTAICQLVTGEQTCNYKIYD